MMENRKIFQHRCTSVLFTASKNTWDSGNSILQLVYNQRTRT